ncbi:MAG TPA: hypothetical protein VHI98_19735 [Vicinamibacterales bacterium]|jgi:hypothetical protein|nr:hypothetical protein [Vicinamibacterales bacterium]
MTQSLRLRPDIVPLQWHEAVAVVQTVATQLLASGDTSLVPATAGLAIDHNGGIHIVDSRSTTGAGPAALAALLRELLQFSSSTPPPLASLAEGIEGTSPRFRSMEEFSEALRFFERPLSQHDLAAHAARLATAQEQRRLNAELEHLTQKARDGDAQPVEKETKTGRRRRPNSRKVAVAVLAAGLLVVATFAGALAGWNKIGAETMREVGSRLVERARSEAKAILPSDAPPPPARQTAAAADPSQRRRHRRPVLSDNASATPVLPVVHLPFATATPIGPPPGLAAASAQPAAVAEPTPDEIIIVRPSYYSRANRDVEPPVILRPHVRSELTRPARDTQLPTLALDIDAEGTVSQIRLENVSAEQRYYAGMLVAAAKAWRFRPALKEGRPVRYRLRLIVSP